MSGATCRTCGGTVPRHIPSVLDPDGVGNPAHAMPKEVKAMTPWEKEVREVLHDFGVSYKVESAESRKESLDTALTAIREANKKYVVGYHELLKPDAGQITNGVITERNALRSEQRKSMGEPDRPTLNDYRKMYRDAGYPEDVVESLVSGLSKSSMGGNDEH